MHISTKLLLASISGFVIFAAEGCGGGSSSASSPSAGVSITSVSPNAITGSQVGTITLNGNFNDPGNALCDVQFVQNGKVINSTGNWASSWDSSSKITIEFQSATVYPVGTYDIQVTIDGSNGSVSSAISNADKITFK